MKNGKWKKRVIAGLRFSTSFVARHLYVLTCFVRKLKISAKARTMSTHMCTPNPHIPQQLCAQCTQIHKYKLIGSEIKVQTVRRKHIFLLVACNKFDMRSIYYVRSILVTYIGKSTVSTAIFYQIQFPKLIVETLLPGIRA